MGAPSGSLIAYATAPGEVAEDGPGANSPYTAALAEAMTVSGLTVEQALKRVRNVVMQATGNRQIPWESSSLVGDFFFEKAVGTAKVPIPSFLPAERELSESEIRELLTDYRLRGGDEDFISEIYFGPDQVARDQTFYPRNRRAKSLSRDYTWEVTSNSDLCLTLLRGVPGDEIGDRNCVKLTCKDGNTLILYSPRYARQMIWYRIGAEKQCP